jgi:hypothetical protein
MVVSLRRRPASSFSFKAMRAEAKILALEMVSRLKAPKRFFLRP